MYKYLIDTDILIDFSKGKSDLLKTLFSLQSKSKALLYVTSVNVVEFMNDKFLLNNKKKEEEALGFLSNFKILAIDKKSGILAGQFLREGKTDYIVDALLAGCGISKSAMVVTRNKKHFEKIEGLAIVTSVDDL